MLRGKGWGHWGTRVAGCFLTGLSGLLPGLEKYPKHTSEVSLEYHNCFKLFILGYSSDTYQGRIGEVRYQIWYPIRIRWLAEVSVHLRVLRLYNTGHSSSSY